MGTSHESSHPILTSNNNSTYRASARFSTYSSAPTLAPSIAPSHISSESAVNDPRAQEIKSWNAGFERLDDKRLQQQRYIVSNEKNDDMSKLALGAKLDRALQRRMTGQDAVFSSRDRSGSTARTLNEKTTTSA